MIRIQKLKQPKKTSGKKLEPGGTVKIKGLEIKNNNKIELWVDTYERKSYSAKGGKQ